MGSRAEYGREKRSRSRGEVKRGPEDVRGLVRRRILRRQLYVSQVADSTLHSRCRVWSTPTAYVHFFIARSSVVFIDLPDVFDELWRYTWCFSLAR